MILSNFSILCSKDARLPEQLQRTMAAEAEAGRAARAKVDKGYLTTNIIKLNYLNAKVIAADGEMRASNALAEASGVIESSPAAIKLRYLQVRTEWVWVSSYYMYLLLLSDPQCMWSREEFHSPLPSSNGYVLNVQEDQVVKRIMDKTC